jgi:hypothetical protein
LPCWSATAGNPYSPQKSSMVTEAGLSMFCSIHIRLSIHHKFFRKEILDHTITMWRSWIILHWHGNVIMSITWASIVWICHIAGDKASHVWTIPVLCPVKRMFIFFPPWSPEDATLLAIPPVIGHLVRAVRS